VGRASAPTAVPQPVPVASVQAAVLNCNHPFDFMNSLRIEGKKTKEKQKNKNEVIAFILAFP